MEDTRSRNSSMITPERAWSLDWRMGITGLYYILCLVLTTTVTGWVRQWVGQHGWVTFNRYLRIVSIACAVLMVGLMVRKICRREGSIRGWLIVIGTGVGLYLLASHLVVLGTEYVHYPQYAILYTLLYWATRGHTPWSLAICVAAGTFDEAIQAFIPQRVLDINDVLLNVAGSLIGLILVWLAWPTFPERYEA